MIAKIHITKDKRAILAVCDKDIVGKIFREGDKQIDLSSDFYKGKEMGEEEAANLLKTAHIINIAGKKSIKFAVKYGMAEKKDIKVIAGVSHAQILFS